MSTTIVFEVICLKATCLDFKLWRKLSIPKKSGKEVQVSPDENSKELTEKQVGLPDFLWFGKCEIGYVVDRIELQSSRGGEKVIRPRVR